MPNFDWDDNDTPLAYLITIRTYGTWLHGDKRFSVDRRGQNIFDTPKVKPIQKLNKIMRRESGGQPVNPGAGATRACGNGHQGGLPVSGVRTVGS